jgi:hypothetical protein
MTTCYIIDYTTNKTIFVNCGYLPFRGKDRFFCGMCDRHLGARIVCNGEYPKDKYPIKTLPLLEILSQLTNYFPVDVVKIIFWYYRYCHTQL